MPFEQTIGVVIVNYCTGRLVVECLESLENERATNGNQGTGRDDRDQPQNLGPDGFHAVPLRRRFDCGDAG